MAIRALTARGGAAGADYHDQPEGHWIDGPISTPMSVYPEYRGSRRSFGLNVLGTVVVEVEASDGSLGFAPTTGGEPAAWIIEKHLSRFVLGAPVEAIAEIWDKMFRGSLFYGRRGLVLNAISGIDLALYDLLGHVRGLPVHALIGGTVRDEILFYATGPRPDIAEQLGFIGGKVPLLVTPDGRPDVAGAVAWRDRVGDDFALMLDCWMSLELTSALEIASSLRAAEFSWMEEPLPPDDYWGYAELTAKVPDGLAVTTGEHESTRWGFQLLLQMGCANMLQPDVGWCGGMTELLRIAELAERAKVPVVPHGSSVYSYHFVVTQANSPISEFLMMHHDGSAVVPMFSPLLLDEPVPENGRMPVPDGPGFGVRLNPDVPLRRPYGQDEELSR